MNSKRKIFGGFSILVLIFLCGVSSQISAQDQYVIGQAQQAVKDKIVRDNGGSVNFTDYGQAETYYISRSQTGVRGRGSWSKNYNSGAREFSYEAQVNKNGGVGKITYRFSNNNDNSGGNGGGGGNVPSWAVGTFYGRSPQDGSEIVFSVSNNGSVVVRFDNGSTNYATIRGDRLDNNGVFSRITKINNGIRTTRLDNGETIDYYADRNYGNNRGGNVPNWAVGTFYARNPQTGGTITLTINTDGNVVIDFDGGDVTYATVNGDRLINNGIESRITKTGNGIRTTRVDNGERIDYRRRN